MLGDDVLHFTGLKGDIPGPMPEASTAVDGVDPFTQRLALGLVLRAVGAFDLEGERLIIRAGLRSGLVREPYCPAKNHR
jgi:hypothetical protein